MARLVLPILILLALPLATGARDASNDVEDFGSPYAPTRFLDLQEVTLATTPTGARLAIQVHAPLPEAHVLQDGLAIRFDFFLDMAAGGRAPHRDPWDAVVHCTLPADGTWSCGTSQTDMAASASAGGNQLVIALTGNVSGGSVAGTASLLDQRDGRTLLLAQDEFQPLPHASSFSPKWWWFALTLAVGAGVGLLTRLRRV